MHLMRPACVGRSALSASRLSPSNDEVAVERWLLAFVQRREIAVEFQDVVRDRVMVILDRRFSFKLQHRHNQPP